MKVAITQDHIDNGVKRNMHECAIALALKEHFQVPKVFITRFSCRFAKDGCEYNFALSSEGYEFVWDFDHGCNVSPFVLELY